MNALIYEFFTTFEMKLLFFRFYRIQQIKFAFVDEVDDKFSEKRVGPGEPWAGEIVRIVLVEGLMHEACACIGVHQCLDAPLDFFVIIEVKAFIMMLIGQTMS